MSFLIIPIVPYWKKQWNWTLNFSLYWPPVSDSNWPQNLYPFIMWFQGLVGVNTDHHRSVNLYEPCLAWLNLSQTNQFIKKDFQGFQNKTRIINFLGLLRYI